MDQLVKKLSEGRHRIQANRPDKSVQGLQERIELGYVHILFQEVGTEIGIQLDRPNCNFSKADFGNGEGVVYFEGCITLNYERVKCIAEISLTDMEGEGYLCPVTEDEYRKVISN